MDATQADIYLVSRLDRSMVIGRPYIYMAVDTATQLITGIYVGLEAGEGAVMQCLENAALDKVKFCRGCGIDITPEQWPSKGLPHEIITDKGREFLGGRMEELCRRYGVEVQSLPPFRPDRKGLVEKAFDLLQQRYKPLLRGKGVIEPDAQERWSTDYRAQAVLDLQEFTQVLLHCIVYLNSGWLLSDGETPAQKWLAAEPQLLDAPTEDLHSLALPRVKVKYTRSGFKLNGLYYIPEKGCPCIGDTYTLAYDPTNVSYVRLIVENNYYNCSLAASCQGYGGYTTAEVESLRMKRQRRSKEAQKNEVLASTAAIRGIQEVVQGAQGSASGKQTGTEIKQNREAERGRMT